MALLIPGKTDIQCRSHHHKYELKYKYPYRIIKEEKAKLEAEGLSFDQTYRQVKNKKSEMGETKVELKGDKPTPLLPEKEKGVQVEIQTEMRDVRMVIMTEEEYMRQSQAVRELDYGRGMLNYTMNWHVGGYTYPY